MKPPEPSWRLTGTSKLAIFRRFTPKTAKNASQNDLASASSEYSPSHSFEKAMARALISFQLSGIPAHLSFCTGYGNVGKSVSRTSSAI